MRQIRLALGASTFLLRLRMQLQARRGLFASLVASGLFMPTILLLLTHTQGRLWLGYTRLELFLRAATFNVGVFVGLAAFVTVMKSIRPSRLESMLPKAITMRYDGLYIEPRAGEPYDASWAWVVRAEERATGLDLVVGLAPPLVISVDARAIRPDEMEQIRIWLERNRKMERRSEGG